jgi:PPK2 family polyphosphate:nucleotide phosphotransferase
MDIRHFLADPKKFDSLKDYSTDKTYGVSGKEESAVRLIKYKEKMQILQDRLYADGRYSLLLIFQAMDGAGKDSTINHVMSGINPQGCQVYSFKKPSNEELNHDFLWRTSRCLPERGRIGIFNRSYYEEVLIAQVHPEIILQQRIPEIDSVKKISEKFWMDRYESINNLEKHLFQNGTLILKFFLNVSKEEQTERFLKRINDPKKNWKFMFADIEESNYWNKYQNAYERMIKETSTHFAPWYIIPADKKWYMQMAVADVIMERLEELKLQYPEPSSDQIADLEKGRNLLDPKSQKKG